MDEELLKQYGELPESLSFPLAAMSFLSSCHADTSDCSSDSCPSDVICTNDCNDSCSSDCSDCSDCYDVPVTYPYIGSTSSTNTSISWTVYHGTQSNYNYCKCEIYVGSIKVSESGWNYFTSSLAFNTTQCHPGVRYTVYLYYNNYAGGSGTLSDTEDIRTSGTAVLPSFTASASYYYIRVSITTTEGYQKYRVFYRKASESSANYVDYSGQRGDFNCDITNVVSGTNYVVNVRAEDVDGNQVFLSDGVQVFVQYRLSATISFSSGSGSGTFSNISSGYIGSDSTSQDVNLTIPSSYVPTPPSGYMFTGWKIGSTVKSPGQDFTVSATTSDPTYSAAAQYSVGSAFVLDTGSTWVNAVPYIDNGTSFVRCSSYRDNGSTWEN